MSKIPKKHDMIYHITANIDEATHTDLQFICECFSITNVSEIVRRVLQDKASQLRKHNPYKNHKKQERTHVRNQQVVQKKPSQPTDNPPKTDRSGQSNQSSNRQESHQQEITNRLQTTRERIDKIQRKR